MVLTHHVALRLIAQDPETVNDTLTKLQSLTPSEIKSLYAPNSGSITDHSGKVTFTINYHAFRLYPDAPTEGQDKRSW
jgi:hypothetical protein